jgi:hypothetical protein
MVSICRALSVALVMGITTGAAAQDQSASQFEFYRQDGRLLYESQCTSAIFNGSSMQFGKDKLPSVIAEVVKEGWVDFNPGGNIFDIVCFRDELVPIKEDLELIASGYRLVIARLDLSKGIGVHLAELSLNREKINFSVLSGALNSKEKKSAKAALPLIQKHWEKLLLATGAQDVAAAVIADGSNKDRHCSMQLDIGQGFRNAMRPGLSVIAMTSAPGELGKDALPANVSSFTCLRDKPLLAPDDKELLALGYSLFLASESRPDLLISYSLDADGKLVYFVSSGEATEAEHIEIQKGGAMRVPPPAASG